MKPKIILRLLKKATIAYIIMVAVLFFLQRSLLYQPFGDYASPEERGSKHVQELWLPTANSKHKALAWFMPPPEDSTGKVVVFFHGNGGSIAYGTSLMEMLYQKGFGALTPEYPGYPGAGGSANETAIYTDARASMEFLLQQGYAADDIILLGQSLGSGVAVQMASEYEVGLIALISPYTTIYEAAANIYWYVPVRYLMLDRFDSLSKIKNINAPLYVFHGTEDTLIPFVLGERLFAEANEPKQFFALEGRGHNDINLAFVVQQIEAFVKEQP